MPQLSTLHIDQPLTEISVLFANANEDFAGTILLPEVTVEKRSDKYFVYGKEHLKIKDATRRPGTEANEVDWSVSTDSYYCEEYALRDAVPYAEIKNADAPIQPEIDSAEMLTYNLMLNEEKQIADLVTSNTNVTQYLALSGTSQWSDYTNSTPLTNLKNAKAAVRAAALRAPNTFLVPYEVGLTLADHPSIKQLVQYTDSKALATTGLPPVIRGLKVIEAAVMHNSANEGQAVTLAGIWGKNALVAYVTGAPRLKSLSFGYHMVGPDEQTGAKGFATRKWDEDKRKAVMVETSKLWDNKLITASAAYLFQTAVA